MHRIETRYSEHTSRTMCDGSTQHLPATAEAWIRRGERVEITTEYYPDLEPGELIEKAVAILRHRIR